MAGTAGFSAAGMAVVRAAMARTRGVRNFILRDGVVERGS